MGLAGPCQNKEPRREGIMYKDRIFLGQPSSRGKGFRAGRSLKGLAGPCQSKEPDRGRILFRGRILSEAWSCMTLVPALGSFLPPRSLSGLVGAVRRRGRGWAGRG